MKCSVFGHSLLFISGRWQRLLLFSTFMNHPRVDFQLRNTWKFFENFQLVGEVEFITYFVMCAFNSDMSFTFPNFCPL